MQLRHDSDIFFSGGELTFRQSRLIAVIGCVVLSVLFAGAGPLWYYLEAPWFVVIMCGLTALLVVPYFISNAVATCRATNWLMRLDKQQLWLNIRSYSHHNYAAAATVIETSCGEIESVSKQRSTFVGPMDIEKGGVRAAKSTVLQIRFREPIPAEVVEAIKAERQRIVSHRYFGFVTVTSRSHDDPVSLSDEHTLKVLWSSQNSMIRPSLEAALESLHDRGVDVGRAEKNEWLWSSLSPLEQDQMIEELENRGQVIEARRLTERREQARPNQTKSKHKLLK
jgi:hypothetical protein